MHLKIGKAITSILIQWKNCEGSEGVFCTSGQEILCASTNKTPWRGVKI